MQTEPGASKKKPRLSAGFVLDYFQKSCFNLQSSSHGSRNQFRYLPFLSRSLRTKKGVLPMKCESFAPLAILALIASIEK